MNKILAVLFRSCQNGAHLTRKESKMDPRVALRTRQFAYSLGIPADTTVGCEWRWKLLSGTKQMRVIFKCKRHSCPQVMKFSLDTICHVLLLAHQFIMRTWKNSNLALPVLPPRGTYCRISVSLTRKVFQLCKRPLLAKRWLLCCLPTSRRKSFRCLVMHVINTHTGQRFCVENYLYATK